jgi:hypothetical protein
MVRLLSGGPEMSVSSIPNGFAVCDWFDGAQALPVDLLGDLADSGVSLSSSGRAVHLHPSSGDSLPFPHRPTFPTIVHANMTKIESCTRGLLTFSEKV